MKKNNYNLYLFNIENFEKINDKLVNRIYNNMNSYKKIDKYGTICWYKKGTDILHREDGPAIEYYNGDKRWYYEGKFHRINGPACEFNNGNKYWYYYGERIFCSSQKEFEKIIGIDKQSIIQEALCRQCQRKNDIGISKCWFCECSNPC